MVTKVFSYQRRFMGSCSLTDFSDSCPLPGEMSSQVLEHASIPRNHSLYNNLDMMRESPGEEGGGEESEGKWKERERRREGEEGGRGERRRKEKKEKEGTEREKREGRGRGGGKKEWMVNYNFN